MISTHPGNLRKISEDNFGIRSSKESDNDNDDMYVRGDDTNLDGLNLRKLESGCSIGTMDLADQEQTEPKKISSLMIVFNTWNAMIGCGTVTIPWAFQQSGIFLGILITAAACVFAFTTNYLLLRVAGTDTNFSDTMHRYFPAYGWSISMACFIINFYVGIILFFQVLTQSLYPILLYAIGSDAPIEMTTDWSQFSLSYTCLILLVIVLGMTAPRNTSYIQKVNAFGVIFVVIFLLFIVANGLKSISITEYVYSRQAYDEATQKAQSDASYTAFVPLSGPDFMPLMGILGGGFYFHNMSLTMVQNAERPEHNTRNILIGFLLVFLTYSVIGLAGVYGFTGAAFASFTPSVSLIKENCLNMMASDDIVATFIRACIFCQLLCVNTLLFGLLRSQIILMHIGIKDGIENIPSGDVYLSRGKNFLLSFALCLPSIALAIWYPYVGKLGALIAAFSTMFVIYILPLATFTKAVYWQEKQWEARLCSDDDFELVKPAPDQENCCYNLQNADLSKLKAGEEEKLDEKQQQVKLTSWSYLQVATWSTLLGAYGIAVFIIQLFYLAQGM